MAKSEPRRIGTWNMKTENRKYRHRGIRAFGLLAICGVLSVVLLYTGCGEKPTVEDTNDYLDLIRYIETTEDGRSLFRTEGLIVDLPYTKPNRPGVEFRDSLESVTRNYYGEIPGGFVEKDFGSPFGIVDDAYFEIVDQFRLYILEDSAGTRIEQTRQDRTLRRRAYFLRLNSGGGYGGWLMYGFNGGTPRGFAGMEIKRSNGSTFLGDGLDYQYIEYDKYVTTYWPDMYPPFDSVIVDTFWRQHEESPYILINDIARVTKGDELSIRSFDNNTEYGTTSASVNQLISAMTDSGAVYRLMHGPDYDVYTDTIHTPVVTDVIWDVLFFQEFQSPNRPGGIWCVPYRVQ